MSYRVLVSLILILTFIRCQARPEFSPTPTLPSAPEPTVTLFPWIPERGGQTFLKSRMGKCLFRSPLPVIYPTTSGELRQLAEANGVWVGTSVGANPLRGTNEYSTAVARDFNLIVPEVGLKFEIVHPEPDRYDFCQMDTILAFAEVNGMRVRGHPLVWEQQLPLWVWDLSLSQEQWKALLHDHVSRLVGRYQGEIEEWDVVNELFTEEGTLKATIWYQNIGPEYIELALRWAHDTDPNARLFINEFATENLNSKSDALYALAQDLLGRGVPLHGIGFQMHLTESNPPDPAQVAENFRRFGELGLEVQITELDIRILKPVKPENLAHQAEIYQTLMEICLSAPNCDTFVLWGVSDHNSWIKYVSEEWGSPLILDDAYTPKPAYWALVETLQLEERE